MDKAEAKKLAIKELARRELERRAAASGPSSEASEVAAQEGPSMAPVMETARQAKEWIGDNPKTVLSLAAGPAGPLLGGATAVGRIAASGGVMGGANVAGQQLEQGQVDPVEAGIATAAGAGGQALGEGIGAIGNWFKTKVLGGGQGAAENLDAMAASGASPTVGQVSTSKAVKSAEAFAGRLPGGRGKLADAYEKVDDSLGEALERVVGTVEVDDEAAGRAIKGGIESWMGRTSSKADDLFGKVRTAMPNEMPVAISNVREALTELATEGGELGSALIHPKIRQMAATLGEAAPQGQISAAAAFKLRSHIGRLIGSTRSLNDDVPTAELKRVYGALSDDLRSAAEASGPEALASFNRANNFWRGSMKRIDAHLSSIAKKASPEDAYQAAVSGRKRGATRLRAIRKSLEADEWKTVARSVVEKMGRATPGQQTAEGDIFSSARFLTEWNRLPKVTKEALFSSNMRSDLDKIARSAASIRSQSQAAANPSGTGAVNMMMAPALMGGATFAGTGDVTTTAMVALGTIGAGNGAARLMTNPKFVRWLASSKAVKPNNSVAYVARLSGMNFGDDPEIKMAVRDFISGYESNAQPHVELKMVTR